MGALQEARQRAVGAGLRHAVQVEPGIDLLSAARQLRALAASERRQRRRGRRHRLWRSRNLGGWKWFRRSGGFRGGRRFRIRRSRLRLGGARLFAQRLGLPGDALPQRALFFAQAALAARRGRQFRNRVADVSSAAAIVMAIMTTRWRRASRLGAMFGPRFRQRHRLWRLAPVRRSARRRRRGARGDGAGVRRLRAGLRAGPLADPSTDRPAETALRFSPMAADPAPASCGPAPTGSRLFGTRMTKRMLCRSRPDTCPASAPAPK